MEFEAEIWKYEGPGGWHFVTLPSDIAFQIKAETAGRLPGWGMVKVRATINGVTFETSVFPDKASGSFLLPVKAAVRRTAKLAAGDKVRIRLVV